MATMSANAVHDATEACSRSLIADETSFEVVDDPVTDVRSTERASIGSSRKGSGDYEGTEKVRQSGNTHFYEG